MGEELSEATIQIKPSRSYYLLAPLILLGACGAFALILFVGLRSIDRDLVRVIVPGRITLHLAKPGPYIVFYEYESTIGDRVFSTGQRLQGIQCTLQDAASGAVVHLSRPSGRTSYQSGSASGYSVLEFQNRAASNYDFACGYESGRQGKEVVFAVGPDFSKRIWLIVVPGILLMLGGLTCSIGVAIWIYLKRKMGKAHAAFPSTQGLATRSSSTPP
jgi:hypothetical protein